MPHLRPLEWSASRTVLADAIAARAAAVQGAYDYDIDGALDSGQIGVAYISTLAALHGGLFVHLSRLGLTSGLPADFTHWGNRVHDIMSSGGVDQAVREEAWSIATANPQTMDDVKRLAERCRRFLDVLAISELPTYNALHDDKRFDAYLHLQEELCAAFEQLGLSGINMLDPGARRERRAAVKERLEGRPVDDRPPGQRRSRGAGESEMERPDAPAVRQDHTRVVRLPEHDVEFLKDLCAQRLEASVRQMSGTDGRDQRRELLKSKESCLRVLAALSPDPDPPPVP